MAKSNYLIVKRIHYPGECRLFDQITYQHRDGLIFLDFDPTDGHSAQPIRLACIQNFHRKSKIPKKVEKMEV
jgi:hypothetical protein